MVLCLLGIFGLRSQSSLLKTDIWYDSGQPSTTPAQNGAPNMPASPKTADVEQHNSALLNFHQVKQHQESVTPFTEAFDISKSSRLTVIVVFHSPNITDEHGVWSVVRDGKQITGLTDQRLLRPKSEYRYPVKRYGIPLINTSMQAFSKIRGKAEQNQFVLGQAQLPDSSLSQFSGTIAECLAFNRFLNKTEALKIETYLAIKYGITLIASDYLSSSDIILWDYE